MPLSKRIFEGFELVQYSVCRSKLGMVGKKGIKDSGQNKITWLFANPPSQKPQDLKTQNQKTEVVSISNTPKPKEDEVDRGDE